MSGRPVVIAHRGGAAEAPENTMEAFERAIRLGYPGVEFDVRMSKDGVPVVVHDDHVRAGKVAELSAADLASLPTLDRLLGLPWGGLTLMVEVKPTARDAALGTQVATALVARGLGPQAIVASFSPAVLRSSRQAEPSLRLMALLDSEGRPGDFDGLPFFAWGIDRALIDPILVDSLRSGGRQIWTWTIKNLSQMRRAVALGVDGLITDIPGQVLAALVS